MCVLAQVAWRREGGDVMMKGLVRALVSPTGVVPV